MKKLSIAIALLCVSASASAGQIIVGPPGKVNPDSVMREQLTITNNGDTPVTFQATGKAWAQQDGKNVEIDTRDILLSPSRIEVPAGEKRVVRIARQKASTGQTQAYRVRIRELPAPPKNDGKASAQVLIEYSLPYVFEPASASAPLIKASWKGKELVLTNTGGKAAKIAQVGPQGGEPWVKGLVGWVLPGSTMAFPMPGKAASIQLSVNGQVQSVSAQ